MIGLELSPPKQFCIDCLKGYSDLIAQIKSGEQVFISAKLVTKSRIETRIISGDARLDFCLDHNEFSFHTAEQYSMFLGQKRKLRFFKLTKKQSIDEYVRYIHETMDFFIEEAQLKSHVSKVIIASDFIPESALKAIN
ncbi:TPA: hypothetical protein ACJEU7_002385 [Acinetobacter baumannii]|uniref:hypothetical protein n=1 Tax=Acinetobacter baumannii TaxID=470 RepID=UPI0022520161|nr:hypothetical protein [Acinetobacter baumannii]MCX3034159.1 hypothetical protein [Acinetobacter baumannii]